MSPEFRPEAILEVLERHRVRYVLIGGFAAAIHGSPYVTTDVDITPAAVRRTWLDCPRSTSSRLGFELPARPRALSSVTTQNRWQRARSGI